MESEWGLGMKKNLLKSRFFCLCFVIIISITSVSKIGRAETVDYNKYSNEKISWYMVRQKNHKQTLGPETKEALKNYHAYFVGEDKKEDKVIYLTFDCGYDNGYIKDILKTLKKHKAKATFFVTKQFVKTSAKTCKRMKKRGHLVGNHTSNHPSLPGLSVENIKKEVVGLEDYFYEQTGYHLDKLLRPPMGEYSHRTLKVLQTLGYRTYFWSIAYYDYDEEKQPGKEYVIKHFKDYHHNGAIPLIHATSQSNAQALDEVLTYLEGQGYRFGLVTELGK